MPGLKDATQTPDLLDDQLETHEEDSKDVNEELAEDLHGPDAVTQIQAEVDAAKDALDQKLHEKEDEAKTIAETTKDPDQIDDYAALPSAPKDGIVLGPDEPLRVEGEEHDNFIHLTKPVYRAFRPFRTKRWQFRLEYSAHQIIPLSVVKRSQEAAEQAKAEKEDAKEDANDKIGEPLNVDQK